MARRFTIELIMDLASRIGANPAKAISRSNISFLGKGPTKNPLFQNHLAGLENATKANLGKPETLFEAIDDAVGWAKDGKLNSIQTEILGHNLKGIEKIINPPPLPMASITTLSRSGLQPRREWANPKQGTGIKTVAPKPRSDIDQLLKEGYTDARGRRWDFKTKLPGSGKSFLEEMGARGHKVLKPGTPEYAAYTKKGLRTFPGGVDLPQKTASARATMIRLLDVHAGGQPGVGVTLREIMSQKSPNDLKWLLEGGGGAEGDPVALFAKYFGPTATRNLPSKGTPEVIEEFSRKIMRMKDSMGRKIDDPFFNPDDITFAQGGLAEILQAPRSGYSKGRLVKGALTILNRNKKNADYMFKASDNVSPGYAAGDLKYNAELLADQLADDAGVVFADLDSISQTKFYGTAYDYLAKEMGQYRQMTKMLKDVEQKMQLSDFSIKGRKPSASGGLAGILEV